MLYVYVITESGGCTLAASKNCKLTVLQHSFSMTLKKTIGKKAMPNLFPTTSLIWAAIPSLKPEQACVSCLGWGGVETIKIFKKMGNLVISAPQNTIAKTGNQANYRTTDDCIQTMGYIYTMQYFSTIKK